MEQGFENRLRKIITRDTTFYKELNAWKFKHTVFN